MPVHIDDGYGEWNAFMVEPFHKLFILILRVPMVSAPPVTQDVSRQERSVPAQMVKIFYSLGYLLIVAKEIPILAWPFLGEYPGTERIGLPAYLIRFAYQACSAIVNHCPAIFGYQAWIQCSGAVDLIESSGGSSQIAFLLISIMPGTLLSA